MKDMLRLGGILFVVCFIAGGSLALVYQSTKNEIEKNHEIKSSDYRKIVLPRGEDYKQMQDNKNIYIAYDKDGREIGKVVFTKTKGYSGEIEMIVGINESGKITGIKILKQTETPGLGSKIENNEFLDQFKGKKIEELSLKKDSENGNIDAITGATISSRSVTKGLYDALKEFKKKNIKKYKDGVYKSNVKGYSGLIQVTVIIKKGKIVKIDANAPYETKTQWNSIIDKLNPQVIKKQATEDIDAVTSATESSNAYLQAIHGALEQSIEE